MVKYVRFLTASTSEPRDFPVERRHRFCHCDIDVLSRHNVIEREPHHTAEEPGVDTDETARCVRRGDHVAKGGHRQAHVGEDVEIDGQGGKTVSTFQNESEELAAVHTRHTAGHLSAATVHIHAVRERPGRTVCQRTFQCVHIERDPKMQTGH